MCPVVALTTHLMQLLDPLLGHSAYRFVTFRTIACSLRDNAMAARGQKLGRLATLTRTWRDKASGWGKLKLARKGW